MRSEDRLRSLLREAQVPDAAAAERRGLLVVGKAFADRERPRRSPVPRVALVLATVLALAALVLSPAGAAVRSWVREVFTASTPTAAPALTEVPGGGRLLVDSADGAWVVQPDGSRRLLGDYAQASWSPHGLFVAAVSGHTLSAIEPDGTAHWSLSAPGLVRDPSWSPSGFRIAYRSGAALRVVVADGSGDGVLARRVAPVPPVWFPLGPDYLAYVDAGGRLQIRDTDSGASLGSAPALPGTTKLDWSPDGSTILEASPHSLRVRAASLTKIAGRIHLGAPREIPLPTHATLVDAAFSSRTDANAVVHDLPAAGSRPSRSELALIDPSGGGRRRLLSVPGSLAAALWSPDGSRLLVPWSDADQWLFIPARGGRPGRAFGPVSTEFAPGSRPKAASFPQLEGWCCPTRGAAGQG
ncbi:MAG: hypothetical protein ACHQCF_03540 [Solirubrobacterales bacterium]